MQRPPLIATTAAFAWLAMACAPVDVPCVNTGDCASSQDAGPEPGKEDGGTADPDDGGPDDGGFDDGGSNDGGPDDDLVDAGPDDAGPDDQEPPVEGLTLRGELLPASGLAVGESFRLRGGLGHAVGPLPLSAGPYRLRLSPLTQR